MHKPRAWSHRPRRAWSPKMTTKRGYHFNPKRGTIVTTLCGHIIFDHARVVNYAHVTHVVESTTLRVVTKNDHDQRGYHLTPNVSYRKKLISCITDISK